MEWSGLGIPAALVGLTMGGMLVQMLPFGLTVTTPTGSSFDSPTLSLAPGETFLSLIRLAGLALFVILCRRAAANGRSTTRLLAAILVIVAAEAVIALCALTLWGDSGLFLQKTAYLGFATGTFINRNALAMYLTIGAAVGTALAFRQADLWFRAPPVHGASIYALALSTILAALLLVLVAVVATGSRMGLFAALLACATVAGLWFLKRRPGVTALRAVLAAAAFLFIVAAFFSGQLLERLDAAGDAADARLALYAQVGDMIAARPWTGWGAASFEIAFPLFQRAPLDAELLWDKAHSTPLVLWAELGFIFGTLPMLAMVLLGMRALRLALSPATGFAAPAAAFAALLAAGAHSLVDFGLEIQANAYLLLAVLAVGTISPWADWPKRDNAEDQRRLAGQ